MNIVIYHNSKIGFNTMQANFYNSDTIDGFWGDWQGPQSCPTIENWENNYIKAFHTRVQGGKYFFIISIMFFTLVQATEVLQLLNRGQFVKSINMESICQKYKYGVILSNTPTEQVTIFSKCQTCCCNFKLLLDI